METLVKIIVGAIVTVVVVAGVAALTIGLVALASALPALLLWGTWLLSGAHYVDFRPTFVEVWAGLVALNVVRNLLVHGLVPKEAVQSATTRLKR